jgi:hypothetical protein
MSQVAPQGSLFDGIMPYIRKTGMFALAPVNSENPHIFRASGDVDTDEETSRNLYGRSGHFASKVEYEAQMQPRAKLSIKVGTRAVSTRWRTQDDEAKAASRLMCPHEGCEKWWGTHNKDKFDKHVLSHGGA